MLRRQQHVLMTHGVVLRRLCDQQQAPWPLNINGLLFRPWAHAASSSTPSSSSSSSLFASVSGNAPESPPAEGSRRQLTHEELQRLLLLHLQEARSCPKASSLAAGVSRCDRRAISSAITLCESTNPAHHPTVPSLPLLLPSREPPQLHICSAVAPTTLILLNEASLPIFPPSLSSLPLPLHALLCPQPPLFSSTNRRSSL